MWRASRGASAIILGLSLSAVLGAAGLAVDGGVWYNDKRSVQGVADLAAWTAVQTFYNESEGQAAVVDARNAAMAVAGMSGLSNGSNGVVVTVNNPPLSGAHAGLAGAFEVIISKPEALFFSIPFLNTVSVTGRAVAAVTTVTTGSGQAGCIFSKTNVAISGGATINATSCGVYADGSSSSALSVSGGATLNTDGISVVGGVSQTGGGVINDSGSKVTGAAPLNDPYAGNTIAGAEAGLNMTCPNGAQTSYGWSSTPYNLSPGVYCGGLSFSNGLTANLSPGVYIIYGGQFSVSGGSTVTANGVTIVLTGSGSNFASFSISGGSTFSITAPSSGPTAGLAFFGDPNNTTSVTFDGGAGITVNGAIYFPGQTVTFSGGLQNSESVCTQLDANNIVLDGGIEFGNNCTGYGTQQIGGTSITSTIEMLE